MAYNANELYKSASGTNPFPRCEPRTIQPKTFASGSGTLDPLTPVAFNTSSNKWVVWANGGANGAGTIKGFVGFDAVVLDSDEEVLGNVILEGKLHLDDIPVPSGQTLSNLKIALRSGPRDLGLIIQGLDQVR